MTRLKKLLIAGLMVIVTCCVSLGSALLNITQSLFSWVKIGAMAGSYDYGNKHDNATYENGDILTVNNIPTTAVKGGEPVYIPKTALTTDIATGTATTVSETVVQIKNPYGVLLNVQGESGEELDSQLTLGTGEHSNQYVLTPSQVGVYTVQYAVKNTKGYWTLSNIYKINVTAESYTMDFGTNSSIVNPSKIDTNQNVDTTVTLDLPKVYDKNGTQIKQFVLGDYSNGYYFVATYKNFAEGTTGVWLDQNNIPTVYVANDPNAQGKNVYSEYWGYEIEKKTGSIDSVAYPYALAVTVKVPGETLKTNSVSQSPESMIRLKEENLSENKAMYNAVAYTFTAGSGKNTITYKLCKYDLTNFATPDAYVTRTINGSTSYDKSKIEIGTSTSSSVKSSETSINVKQYLPAVNAVNKNENKTSVSAYYYYTVKFIDENDKYDLTPEAVTMGIDEKGVYFIPHKEGEYNISFNAKDFYGNTDKLYEDYDYDVNVTDRTSPSLYYVNNYDFATKNAEELKANDYSYVIPSSYYFKEGEDVEIAVPAIFTEDNYKAFDDLKISRSITSENSFINSNGEQVKNFTLNIQSATGTTDTIAKDSGKNIDVKDGEGENAESKTIIYFKDAEYSTYYVKNNEFYAKDAEGNKTDEKLTGAKLIQAKTSQVAYIKLDSKLFGEGEYTIEYSVQDGRYSNNSGKTFKFNLTKYDASNPIDSKAPTVKFGNLNLGNVTRNQKISVTKPEVKDNVDENILVKYFVEVDGNYLPLSLDSEDKLTFNTNDTILVSGTAKSIYDLALNSSEKAFNIVAIAYDDFASADLIANPETVDLNNPQANIGVGKYKVSVVYISDTKAPVIKSIYNAVDEEGTVIVNEDNENKQFKDYVVHGIKYYDNTATARITIKIVNSLGEECEYQELDGTYIKKLTSAPAGLDADYVYEYNFAGVQFTANYSDNYTVTYSIVDGGNNIATYSFVVRKAIDAEAPAVDGFVGIDRTLELGESLFFTNLKVTDNTTAEEDINLNVTVKGAKTGIRNSFFNPLTKEFTPTEVDEYTITITATDAENNSTVKSIVIKVQDTQKPTLTLIGAGSSDIPVDEGDDLNQTDIDWANSKFPQITLPGFSVEDYNEGLQGFEKTLGANGKLTITTPDGDTYSIDVNGNVEDENNNPLKLVRKKSNEGTESNYYFYFTPTQRGKYVATYTATDFNGNSADKQEVIVSIGDTEMPNIYLTDSLLNVLNKGFVINENDQLVINPKARVYGETGYTSKDLYVKDNYGFGTKVKTDDDNNKYVTVSVSVVNENNNTISQTDNSDGLVIYDFTKAGTYTITFTVVDGVGNTGTFSKTFKVTAKTTTSSDTTKVLGIVLIVVSVVILAGVVIYFVKGTKFLPKRNKNKVKKENSEKKD